MYYKFGNTWMYARWSNLDRVRMDREWIFDKWKWWNYDRA